MLNGNRWHSPLYLKRFIKAVNSMFDDFIKIPVILLFQRVRNKILHAPKHAEVSVQKLGAVTNLIHS